MACVWWNHTMTAHLTGTCWYGRKTRRRPAHWWQSSESTRIVQRRELVDTLCPNLLVLPDGRPVTYRMISRRWEDARDAAAYRSEVTGDTERGKQIRAMYLRDMRSFAANLAEDIDEASKLLDHSSVNVTRKHYRTRATRLKAVR